MFAVMLAFVILLALQSYQRAREGSSVEAIAVSELHSVASVFQPPLSDRLHGELVCYGRAVIEDEWPAMRKGRSSDLVQSWIDKLGRDFAIAEPHGAREETAYAQWFDEQAQRRDGRRSASPRRPRSSPSRCGSCWAWVPHSRSPTWSRRPTGARGDLSRRYDRLRQRPRDRGPSPGLFPRPPYTNESGSIAPTEMRRTLTLIDPGIATPCDERGTPIPRKAIFRVYRNHLFRSPTFLAVSTGASRRRIPCLVVFLWIRSRSTWSA